MIRNYLDAALMTLWFVVIVTMGYWAAMNRTSQFVTLTGEDGIVRTVVVPFGIDWTEPEIAVQVSELAFGDTCVRLYVHVDREVTCGVWGPDTADRAAD